MIYQRGRWLVRGMLAVSCAVLLVLASAHGAKADDGQVASALRKLGVLVKADEKGWVRELSFSAGKFDSQTLALVSELTKIEVLDLAGRPVTDDALAFLEKLGSLQVLVLAKSKVTDEGLGHLAALEELTGLDLSDTAVTGSGLPQLKKLHNLEELLLTNTPFGDAEVPGLASLPNLKTVYTGGTKLTSQGLRQLKQKCPKLVVLR